MGAGGGGIIVLLPIVVFLILKALWNLTWWVFDPNKRTFRHGFWILLPVAIPAIIALALFIDNWPRAQAIKATENAVEFSAFTEQLNNKGRRTEGGGLQYRECPESVAPREAPLSGTPEIASRFEIATVDSDAYVDEGWVVERHVERRTSWGLDEHHDDPDGFAFRATENKEGDRVRVRFQDGRLYAFRLYASFCEDRYLSGVKASHNVEWEEVAEYPPTFDGTTSHSIDVEHGGMSSYLGDYLVPVLTSKEVRRAHPNSEYRYCEISIARLDRTDSTERWFFDVATEFAPFAADRLEGDGWDVVRYQDSRPRSGGGGLVASRDGEQVVGWGGRWALYPRECSGPINAETTEGYERYEVVDAYDFS